MNGDDLLMGKMKEIVMEGGNVECIYSFYGLNRLRCSREENNTGYCQYWKNCEYFRKA